MANFCNRFKYSPLLCFIKLIKTNAMKTIENLNLTDLEKKVIDVISLGDEYEGTPAEGIQNISISTGLSTKVLRGVLSSLLKKEIISEGEFPNGKTSFHLEIEL